MKKLILIIFVLTVAAGCKKDKEEIRQNAENQKLIFYVKLKNPGGSNLVPLDSTSIDFISLTTNKDGSITQGSEVPRCWSNVDGKIEVTLKNKTKYWMHITTREYIGRGEDFIYIADTTFMPIDLYKTNLFDGDFANIGKYDHGFNIDVAYFGKKEKGETGPYDPKPKPLPY